jgi:hypothetical protein
MTNYLIPCSGSAPTVSKAIVADMGAGSSVPVARWDRCGGRDFPVQPPFGNE